MLTLTFEVEKLSLQNYTASTVIHYKLKVDIPYVYTQIPWALLNLIKKIYTAEDVSFKYVFCYFPSSQCIIIVLLLQKEILCSSLCNRGPDAQNGHQVSLTRDSSALFCGFTLHFRGNLTPQPLIDRHENMLLWNGEIFGGIEVVCCRIHCGNELKLYIHIIVNWSPIIYRGDCISLVNIILAIRA